MVCVCVRDRQAAGQRILAQRQVEELREVVEREHLLSAHLTHSERAPPVAHENGVGGRRRRGGLDGQRRERGRHEGQDGHHGSTDEQATRRAEASQRQNASIIN